MWGATQAGVKVSRLRQQHFFFLLRVNYSSLVLRSSPLGLIVFVFFVTDQDESVHGVVWRVSVKCGVNLRRKSSHRDKGCSSAPWRPRVEVR